jgi:hypothetical protein
MTLAEKVISQFDEGDKWMDKQSGETQKDRLVRIAKKFGDADKVFMDYIKGSPSSDSLSARIRYYTSGEADRKRKMGEGDDNDTHSKESTVKRAGIRANNGEAFYYMIDKKESGDGWSSWEQFKGFLGTKKNTYSWTTKWLDKQNDVMGEIIDEIKRRTEGKDKK